MFSNWLSKILRILLFPVALLYGLAVTVRNWLYDHNILKSTSFGLPLICVGNLSVGGTGKSPMVEFLVRNLGQDFQIAILSRGYKRKTRGYALASGGTTAIDVGDEPMQFHYKFPNVPVAVGEERLEAIPQLLHDKPETEAIILDDAFQHRAIDAGLNILLTAYNQPFVKDFYLPTGDLRDSKGSASRADVIVITKCPAQLSPAEKTEAAAAIGLRQGQQLFFTTLFYGRPYHILTKEHFELDVSTAALLVTGIANPTPLTGWLQNNFANHAIMHFGDHHIFSLDDWKKIKKGFNTLTASKKIILTTEKDAMRLLKYTDDLKQLPVFVLPVEHQFLFGEGPRFTAIATDFIKNFKQPVRA